MLLERRGRKRVSEGTWAVSYVDMLTLLLCFFIIFYNSEQVKNVVEITPLQRIIFDLSSKMKGKQAGGLGGTEGVEGIGAGAGSAEKTAITEANLLEMLSKSLSTASTQVRVVGQALEVSFLGLSFFDTGATTLNMTGRETVSDIIKTLESHKGDVRLIVQGHTDTRQVSRKKYNLTDNWELSVLRATSVLKMFIKNGFPSDHLSAEGFADTQVAKAEIPDLAQQRRITLRIEAREHK
ncbi:MAG: OmpA family protein [Deltaproteobacteria bacterium]|nr:OmpA family protein [Deltaproteobacteria bacterium]